MKLITKPQLSKIHVLLNQLDLMDDKKQIVSNFSNGRTQSSKELSFNEAKNLIARLCKHKPNENMRDVIISLAYYTGIIVYGKSEEAKKVNAIKLDLFLKHRGTVKKELNQMNYDELIRTHRQFESIAKNNENNRDKKKADALVMDLLEELNINVQSKMEVRK